MCVSIWTIIYLDQSIGDKGLCVVKKKVDNLKMKELIVEEKKLKRTSSLEGKKESEN